MRKKEKIRKGKKENRKIKKTTEKNQPGRNWKRKKGWHAGERKRQPQKKKTRPEPTGAMVWIKQHIIFGEKRDFCIQLWSWGSTQNIQLMAFSCQQSFSTSKANTLFSPSFGGFENPLKF
jgi:hypothetical protein